MAFFVFHGTGQPRVAANEVNWTLGTGHAIGACRLAGLSLGDVVLTGRHACTRVWEAGPLGRQKGGGMENLSAT